MLLTTRSLFFPPFCLGWSVGNEVIMTGEAAG